MLTVGDKFPAFELKAVTDGTLPDGDFPRMNNQSFSDKWLVVFFWPKDFTFICPTEILAFDELRDEFEAAGAALVGASTDTDFVHLAWRQSREDLAEVGFPWLADNKKELAAALGILDAGEGVALRATFVVDDHGIIRHASVNDLDVGRNPREVLRILEGLKTGELCGCNWQPGQAALRPAA